MQTCKQFSFAHTLICSNTPCVNTPVCTLTSYTPNVKLCPCQTHTFSEHLLINIQSAHTDTHTHSQTRGKLISLTDRRLAAWKAEGAEKVITRDRRTCVSFTSSLPPLPLRRLIPTCTYHSYHLTTATEEI